VSVYEWKVEKILNVMTLKEQIELIKTLFKEGYIDEAYGALDDIVEEYSPKHTLDEENRTDEDRKI